MTARALIIGIGAFILCSCTGNYYKCLSGSADSPIYPDYRDVTVPPGIAPLNFSYTFDVPSKSVTVFSCGDCKVVAKGRKVSVPPGKWRRLTEAATGGDITVASEALDTSWTIHVSRDAIDYGLDYRLIEPGYSIYSKMGIYESELSSSTQTALLRNSEFSTGCCNCHSHYQGRPETMSLHIRGDNACGLIMIDGKMQAYDTKADSSFLACGHTSWHPSGKFICYTASNPGQSFLIQKEQLIEVQESSGNVMVYDVEKNELVLSPLLSSGKYVDSFASFSADGSRIFFTRRESGIEWGNFTKCKNGLYSIDFNSETATIGDDVKVVIDTADIACGSVCFPKPSPDGKYIIFSRADYGIFASWHHESDLWLLDIETGALRPVDEVNSTDSESTPCWSTNGRWMAFGSRRDDGLFTRIYIAHFDPATGRFGKPFMLPQKDPEDYYGNLFFSYNIPEFVTGPAVFNRREAVRLITKGNESGSKRIRFGFRRQGRPEDYDAVTGSSVSAADSVKNN